MAIFNELKSIAKVLQEAGKIEQYKQILEILEKLLEMQKRIADLEDQNKELEEKLKVKDSLTYKNNAYWMVKKDKKDGPFCSRCWDKNKDLIRMHPAADTVYADCPECNNSVQIDPNYNFERDMSKEDFSF